MAMDPKQERALRDGTASVADEPRDTDIESVREQAENPPVSERPRPRRRTAAVADVRVNQEAGTPVDRMARELGAEPVPEMGRAPRNKINGNETDRDEEPDRSERDSGAQRAAQTPTRDQAQRGAAAAAPVVPREARRVMKARREHSKGDGNFPAPEPSPQLLDDERAEDRTPRDIPKSRDDRSAPKGNITAGQDDRNPNLETRDDQRPGPPSRAFSLDAARDAAAMPNAAPRPRPIAEAKRTGPRARAQEKTRGTTRRPTNLAKAKGPALKRATAKRATAKRAGTKRAGTAARNRTTAKRPGKRKR